MIKKMLFTCVLTVCTSSFGAATESQPVLSPELLSRLIQVESKTAFDVHPLEFEMKDRPNYQITCGATTYQMQAAVLTCLIVAGNDDGLRKRVIDLAKKEKTNFTHTSFLKALTKEELLNFDRKPLCVAIMRYVCSRPNHDHPAEQFISDSTIISFCNKSENRVLIVLPEDDVLEIDLNTLAADKNLSVIEQPYEEFLRRGDTASAKQIWREHLKENTLGIRLDHEKIEELANNWFGGEPLSIISGCSIL